MAGPREEEAAAGPPGANRRLGIVGSPIFIDVLVGVLYVLAAGYVSMRLWPDPDARSLALNEPDRVLSQRPLRAPCTPRRRRSSRP